MGRKKTDPKDLIRDLARLLELHGDLGIKEFDRLPDRKFSREVYYKTFGSWGNAKARARRELGTKGNTPFTKPDPTPDPGEDLKTRCKTLQYECEEKNVEIVRLNAQIKQLVERKKIHSEGFYDKTFRCGVVTDTHIGSLYQRLDVLNVAYDIFDQEGIETVYHCGDLCDGEKMYRGHEYEIDVHGADRQVAECVEKYPYREDITTKFIIGNHDMSFYKRAGVDIGEKIDVQRSDMMYLGPDQADMVIGKGDRAVRLRLVHPGKGTAYALSYQPQKYIEALSGGQKPHIILMGHYHKSEHLPNYRNIELIQAGCCQSQTPFMRARSIAANIGFWILEFTINPPNLISRFKTEFFAVFEKEEIKGE